MQTSRIKCIHPQHFVKNYEKRQELCTATPVNTTACCIAAYVCQKQKGKICIALRSAVLTRIILCCNIITIQTANVLRASFFFLPQRRLFFTFVLWCRNAATSSFANCIVHAFTIALCAFSFCFINRPSPQKIKNSKAAESDLCMH